MNSELRFENKSAIIFGGTYGIGRATAEAFANEGAMVTVAGRSRDAGTEAVEAITSRGGKAHYTYADVTDPGSVAAAVDMAVELYGRLDCAFNNAGWEGTKQKTGDISESDWDHMMAVKLKGVWLGVKEELRAMINGGSGSIVNMAGTWGLVGFPNFSSYCTAAHGIMGLTKTAALEYAREGIRINAICPYAVKSPLLDRLIGGDKKGEEQFASTIAIGRIAHTKEVAEAVLWLCSDSSSYVNGEGLVLNGGGSI